MTVALKWQAHTCVGEPIDDLRRLDPVAPLLEKPFSPDTLLDAVQSTLRGPRRKSGALAAVDWPPN